jgi:maltose phosphorylase
MALQLHEAWKIVATEWKAEEVSWLESLFSLGNGLLFSRGYLGERDNSGEKRINYMRGLFYSQAQKDPFFKGLPEQVSHRLPIPDWAALDLVFDGVPFDLNKCHIFEYRLELNLRGGYLKRSCKVRLPNRIDLRLESTRFCSLQHPEIGAQRISITPINLPVHLTVVPLIDNQEHAHLWQETERVHGLNEAYLQLRSLDGKVALCSGTQYAVFQEAFKLDLTPSAVGENGWLGHQFEINLPRGTTTTFYRFSSQLSSVHHAEGMLREKCQKSLHNAVEKGFTLMLKEQAQAWADFWEGMHVDLQDNPTALQAYRYQAFQLQQAAGLNALNWETEAFLLPYYLWQGRYQQAKALLQTRYEQLSFAQQYAKKLGLEKEAALFPAQTFLGSETETDPNLALGSIFRNGFLAWAIHLYAEHTDDREFLAGEGLEMLIAMARFWSQRIGYSPQKQQSVILSVCGPNRYESQVQNHWLTNRLAQWTLRYTTEVLEKTREDFPIKFAGIIGKTDLDFSGETRQWERLAENLYLPEYEDLKLLLQQEGYLDKEQKMVADLAEKRRPLRQYWSYDRLLRSCLLEQADLLWYFYLFPQAQTSEQFSSSFQFYESRTLHEAPLSPAVHAILAASLQEGEKTDRLLNQSLMLDLENVLGDSQQALHFSGMPGAYLVLIQGLLGLRWQDEILSLNPILSNSWKKWDIGFQMRQHRFKATIRDHKITLQLLSQAQIKLRYRDEEIELDPAIGKDTYTIKI